ncbi:hypothetical protein, partial [Rhodococcus opacus]|uniref:hypothetical protein n=1 Tax=Rhodococcus opacus TaxID=37919 RepID=UPI0035B415C9|nr:hypothetical protein [Rhodococcus opacus]
MTVTNPGEKFVKINHSVLDCGLTPQALAIYAAMVRRADWSTRETYVSRGTLAEVIGAKQPRSADKYVRELADVGLILSVRHRWTTQDRDMGDVVFAKDDEHPVQTSSLYALAEAPAASPQVGPQCATAHGGGAPERTGVVRQNAHNQEPLIKNPFTEEMKSARTAEPTRGEMSADEGMSTAQDRAWRDGEPTKDPHPLHPEWAPNRRHRDEAA